MEVVAWCGKVFEAPGRRAILFSFSILSDSFLGRWNRPQVLQKKNQKNQRGTRDDIIVTQHSWSTSKIGLISGPYRKEGISDKTDSGVPVPGRFERHC